MNDISFKLYILFIISFFLHLPARVPFLGVIRFDLLLIVIVFLTLLVTKKIRVNERGVNDSTSIILIILICYIIISVPFVEWPGSVLKKNSLNLIKVIIFYYYTILLIDTERKLKAFMAIFLICQSIRVFEPLYLHITEGYWGDKASMAGEEFMNRLAGAPFDVINPNGLAFVIVSIIPFFYYLGSISLRNGIIYFSPLPVFVYALILTASRSGFLALMAILFSIVIKSQRKVIVIGMIVIGGLIAFASLTAEQKDRYVSVYDENAKNYGTSQGRKQGVIEDFKIALNKPLVGHGLGTSPEARFHSIGSSLLSHNLYTEIMLELGLIGLVIFLIFMKSIAVNFYTTLKKIKENSMDNAYLFNIAHAMQVLFVMNLLFSFASYGLSTYVWYLFGGLSVVIKKLADEKTTLKQG